MRRLYPLLFSLWFSVCCLGACAQPLPLAITTDPPPDRLHPAVLDSMHIPSHGAQLNALLYVAQGAGPHPVVILLDGFPGNERNLDLAQAMRRAGWNVMYFNYRGSWGTPGEFSFGHSLEDTAAVIAFLRDPDVAAQLRTDPKRIVLLGHSLGGFIAAYAAAHDPSVLAVGLISAENLGGMSVAQGSEPAAVHRLSANFLRKDMKPLSGCSAQDLARETVAHRSEWNFDSYAAALAPRPVLIITADDGLAGQGHTFANALHRHGAKRVTESHFATDHTYSSVRIGLEAAVLNWLATLPRS